MTPNPLWYQKRFVAIGLTVDELERHKLNINTKEKHIIQSILKSLYVLAELHYSAGDPPERGGIILNMVEYETIHHFQSWPIQSREGRKKSI